MSTIQVWPAKPGALIRDIETGEPIGDEGALLEKSLFIMRRIKDGSLVTQKPELPKAPAATAPSQPAETASPVEKAPVPTSPSTTPTPAKNTSKGAK